MPRKASGNFDQFQYIEDWKKENMRRISVSYKKDFVEEFRDACIILGIKQSDVFREAMKETIEKAKAGE